MNKQSNKMILKTLPQMNHQNFIKSINANQKHFMHNSYLNHKLSQRQKKSCEKSISPIKLIPKEEIFKKSPSFLKNKKKVNPEKSLEKLSSEKNHFFVKDERKSGLLRMQTLPILS